MTRVWSEMEKPDKVSAVIRYAAKGMTAAQIASQFDGCTRNAIVGLAHRNGIVFANSKGTGRTFDPANGNANEAIQKVRKEAREKSKVTRIKKTAKKPKAEPTVCEVIEFTPPPKRPDPPYSMVDLRGDDCRFPILDSYKGLAPSQMIFCGKPSKEGSPYCAECHAKAHDGLKRVRETGDGTGGRHRKPFFRWQR